MIRVLPNMWQPLSNFHDEIRKNRYHDSIAGIKFRTSSERFTEYFKFGFVRNPWDRTVSLYERKKEREKEREKNKNSRRPFPAQKKETSFEEFVESAKYASSTCVHSQLNRYQLDWFLNYQGDILVDFIGRYERLEEDWATVTRKLGIDTPLRQPKASKGRRRHYTEYYNQKTKDIIAARFAVDIDYFEYEFGK